MLGKRSKTAKQVLIWMLLLARTKFRQTSLKCSGLLNPNYVYLMRGTLMGMEDVNGDGERLIDLYQSGFWFHFKWIDHSAFRVTYFPFQVYTMMKMMMSTCKILTIQIRWNGNFYCLHKRPLWEATGAAESSLINLVFSMCVSWWSRRRLWIMWECNNSSFHSGW